MENEKEVEFAMGTDVDVDEESKIEDPELDLDLESGIGVPSEEINDLNTDATDTKATKGEKAAAIDNSENGEGSKPPNNKKKSTKKLKARRLVEILLLVVVSYLFGWGYDCGTGNTTTTTGGVEVTDGGGGDDVPDLDPGLPYTGPPWRGPWQKYIKAPEDKSRILPERIYKVRGNVSTSSTGGSRLVVAGDEFGDVTGQGRGRGDGILIGLGGTLTVAFKENIGGRICLDIDTIGAGSEKEGVVVVTLAYSESPWFAGPVPDATTDRQARDLPLRLRLKGKRNGKVCVGRDFIRGSFKYFTLSVPVPWSLRGEEGTMDGDDDGVGERPKKRVDRHWLRIRSLWVVSTAYPALEDGRKYTGYFYSSNELLNRIWYAGAWTLQLSTIDPKEGSSLIDYNRLVDHNRSPIGSWYSNFTISNGTSVTTDGAKRDRVVWPGDMFIAVPGIAVSTKDMISVRNALDVLYDHQYGDGSLPYAGPPMGYHHEFSDTYHMHTLLGTYNYVLYSGDMDYLRLRWEAYLRALEVSISKVDSMGLLHVSSVADWLRPGMTGHNVEASAILYTVLEKSVKLASWLTESDNSTSSRHHDLISSWNSTQKTLENGLARLYCPSTGLFSDNIGVRSCKGRNHIDPQDGNSWVLISKLNLSESNLPYENPKSPKRQSDPLPPGVPSPQNISTNLRNRWTKFGAPAVEFPNVISPFASGFELLGHCATGNISAAVELILLEWGYLLDGPGFTNSTLAEGFRVDGHIQYPAYPSPARNSHAHGWSSGPTSVLVSEVVGIEIVRPGGLGVVFRPRCPLWLSFVRGGFEFAAGWAEVSSWRIREWVATPDGYDYLGGKEEGTEGEEQLHVVVLDDELNSMRGSHGRMTKGQKPLVLQLTKHRRPVVRARNEEGKAGVDVVINSKGEKMKKTDTGGIIVQITISEHTREGVISFDGLLQDLWDEEMRRNGGHLCSGGISGECIADGGLSPPEWDIDIDLASSFRTDDDKTRGRRVASLSFWLRWEKREVLDADAGAHFAFAHESYGLEEKSLKGRRVAVAGDGTRYVAWPEVIPLTTDTVLWKSEAGDGGFREPVEVRYVRNKGKKGEKESEVGDEKNVMLRFDEDFVPLEMDTTRPAGVVDWDVMEEYFQTPVYEGWSVDRLKAESESEGTIGYHDGENESGNGNAQDILEREMENGMGFDGGFGEYLD